MDPDCVRRPRRRSTAGAGGHLADAPRVRLGEPALAALAHHPGRRAHVGPVEADAAAAALATQRVREGLPLRAEIACVGFTAQVPEATAKGPLLGAPTRYSGW